MNTLKFGSKGGDVKILQRYLKLKEDGIFGLKTTEIVKQWQKENGLTADGVIGPKSWMKLIENDLKNIKLTDGDMIKIAIELNVELAVIKAIKTVESNGVGIINSIPVMLFEGHVFWKQLQARKIDPNKYVKGNEDILYPKWTKKYYTCKNSGEYNRLKKAIKINELAALESASYGMFQLMGTNYKICGYKDAREFYKDMCASEKKQFYAFIKFIKAKGIVPYMQQKNWAKIAYLYNGSGFKANKYDLKLEQAYNKFK